MSFEDVLKRVDESMYDHHAINTEEPKGDPSATWCGLPIENRINGVTAADGLPVLTGVDRDTCPRCAGRRQKHVDAIVANIYGPAA